jgi:hypothetical protein
MSNVPSWPVTAVYAIRIVGGRCIVTSKIKGATLADGAVLHAAPGYPAFCHRRCGVNLDSQHVAASRRLALREREHEIEPGRLLLAVVVNRHQQPAIEQGVASIAPLAGKVQLGGEDRPVGQLHRHMEVSCASRI